jgi:hypothetical protein
MHEIKPETREKEKSDRYSDRRSDPISVRPSGVQFYVCLYYPVQQP